ncbi:MAG: hypothetical protein D6776_07310, partial [Planctomycetota bacterium]
MAAGATERGERAPPVRRVRAGAVLGAIAWRYLCFAVMTALVLVAERRPAPRLPDLVLAHVPYLPWVDRWNYV